MKKILFLFLFGWLSNSLNAQTEAQFCEQQIKAVELMLNNMEKDRRQITDKKLCAEIDKNLAQAREELKQVIADCTKNYGYKHGGNNGTTNPNSGNNPQNPNNKNNNPPPPNVADEMSERIADIQKEENPRIRACEMANLTSERAYQVETMRILTDTASTYQPCRLIYDRAAMTAQLNFAVDRFECEAVKQEEHLREMKENNPDDANIPRIERKLRCTRQNFIPAYKEYRAWYLNTALSWYEKELAAINKMKISKADKSDEISERQGYLGKIIVESNQRMVAKMLSCSDVEGAGNPQMPNVFLGVEGISPCFTESGDEIMVNKKIKEKRHDNPIQVFSPR
jgi:hypothetical protein